ncbi:hypothetical protein [Hellea balneolensis]|uniref:hypothetical protein n=1 Tax=Hellea balneolensis TaxID=287478 RepID=UPI0012B88506|nr:hypothetical protein [Hellea balneolensis]
MTMLIHADYTPTKDERSREYKVIKNLKTEMTSTHVMKLRPELKKSEAAPPSPPKSKNFARELPTINQANISIQAIINPLKPKIASKVSPDILVASEILENTGIHSKSKGLQSSASDQGKIGTAGQGNSDAGISQCSISFTLLEGGGVEDLSWLNCVDGTIADEAEQALYVWLRQKNEDYLALNAQAGDSLQFTFKRQ